MRIFLIILVAIFHQLASAADWQFLSNSPSNTCYIDKASIKKGVKPKAWFLMDYAEPSKYNDLSHIEFIEANCKEGTLRTITLATYSGRMATGGTTYTNNPENQITYPVPGSLYESYLKALCNLKN
jgi:hypothetical protein